MKQKHKLKSFIAATNITLLAVSMNALAVEKDYTCGTNTQYGKVEMPVKAESLESAIKIATDHLKRFYATPYVTCREHTQTQKNPT
jgi:spore coat polysaccharide biosynthesis protein SpsF (cytidylyltransferase family)